MQQIKPLFRDEFTQYQSTYDLLTAAGEKKSPGFAQTSILDPKMTANIFSQYKYDLTAPQQKTWNVFAEKAYNNYRDMFLANAGNNPVFYEKWEKTAVEAIEKAQEKEE